MRAASWSVYVCVCVCFFWREGEGERRKRRRRRREREIRRRSFFCLFFLLFARKALRISSSFQQQKTHHCVVRVRRRHRSGGLRSELIELGRRDALVDARRDLLGDEDLGDVFFFSLLFFFFD